MTIDPEPSDAEVVARTLAGERAAFAVLVRRYAPIATRTAAVLGAGADADDVVQEAFVKGYRALGSFRPGAEFRPWLLRIVANETRNAQRAARRRTAREHTAHAELLPPLGPPDPAERAQQAAGLAELRRQLLRLAEPHRAVLACRFLLDLDEAETATVLDLARGTVKSRTHRALERLRVTWQQGADSGAADPGTGVRHG